MYCIAGGLTTLRCTTWTLYYLPFFSYDLWYSAVSSKNPLHVYRSSHCTQINGFNKEQDKRYMYHLKMGHVSGTICWSGKAVSITYSDYVSVAFGIQHAMRTRHIIICGLSRSTIFFPYYLINGTIFWGKKVIEQNFVFLCFLQIFLKHFSF